MKPLNSGFTNKLVDVAPAVAASILERNFNNRSLDARRVDMFARIIADGEFDKRLGSIILDADGNLLNGQHRLNAVVKSGCTVTINVKQKI